MALSKVNPNFVGQNLGRRNLIINGAMQVAQRGTSATGVTGITYNSIDRFRSNVNSLGTWTESQSTDAPDEFSNSFKLECTTANSSPVASAYLIVEQKIEAQNLQGLSYGTSSAKKVTLSFWVKSNVTGTYSIAIYGADSSRANAKTFTINTASTWEYKTLTFNGDTTGNINNDNGDGFRLWWILNAGNDWKGGTQVDGVWEAYTLANLAANVTADVGGDVGDTFQITGVQLEVGDTATDFEHRSYGEELSLCQRYYNAFDGGGAGSKFGSGWAASSTMGMLQLGLPVPMRTTPTATIVNAQIWDSASQYNITAVSLTGGPYPGEQTLQLTTSGLTTYRPFSIRQSATGIAIALDSEL